MYLQHFGFQRAPFGVTPDPAFLYLSRSHREALASLVYGIREGRGFIHLSGEVGTGKSTLLRALLEELDVSVRTIWLSHTTIDREEFLRMALMDLELEPGEASRVEMLRKLQDFLLEEAVQGRAAPVLILDEAQNLSDEVLEEVRLLSNVETDERKLLQVVLAAQPELDERLLDPGLRQFRQRIAVRAELEPLPRDEIPEYIMCRLAVAGGDDSELFPSEVLDRLWEATGGVPRLINLLCEASLIYAYGSRLDRVDLETLEEAARDFQIREKVSGRPRSAGPAPAEDLPVLEEAAPSPPVRSELPGWVIPAAVVALVALLAFLTAGTGWRGEPTPPREVRRAAPEESPTALLAPDASLPTAAEPVPAAPDAETLSPGSDSAVSAPAGAADLSAGPNPGPMWTTWRTNFRQGPSLSSPRIGVLPAGQPVQVVGTSGSWCRSFVLDQEGWVFCELLTAQPPPPSLPVEPEVAVPAAAVAEDLSPAMTGFVPGPAWTTARTNFRQGPSLDSPPIRVLPAEQMVEVVETRGSWCRSQVLAEEGWIFCELLAAGPQPEAAGEGRS